MASFNVNESLFVLDLDDNSPSILPVGEMLPDGITIEVDRDRGENYAFYVSADGKYDILAARPELAERWVQEGYLEKRMLQIHCDDSGEIDCYLLISPCAHVLMRLTDVRVYQSPYYAHVVATCMWNTRHHDPFINMRDGILCELYGVVLPTYTKTPKIADAALFNNVLRGQYDPEDIRRDDDFEPGRAGLNGMTFNELMTLHGMECDMITPYFQVGEPVDDFVQLDPKAIITGPLVLKAQYQVFATNSDVVLLAMSQAWAEELIARNYITAMDLKSVYVGREQLRIIALSRRYAVESLGHRHFGIAAPDAYALAVNLRRAVAQHPENDLEHALYLQEYGLVLPTRFDVFGADGSINLPEGQIVNQASALAQADAIITDAVLYGPFAQGPFLDEVLIACRAIVASAQ